MRSKLSHIQFNVQPANIAFYKDLLVFAGWQAIFEGEGFIGLADRNETSVWFVGQVKEVSNDYDGPGMNHLALGVDAQEEVDAAAAYLTDQGVALLFETPRHRPEFAQSEDHTYYQIMFETPDRILIEVVYIGPLAR